MIFEDIEQSASEWAQRGLTRVRRTVDGAQGSVLSIEGRSYLSFLSNDYLGLAGDSRLREALQRGIELYGAGAGASPLIAGHLSCHHEAENCVAEFLRCDRSLMFITGYMANIAVLTTFAREGDVIFSDALNHASLIDGCRLTKARVERFAHRDLAALEARLEAVLAPRKIIVTDAVFSMDGDTAELRALWELAERFDALLIIDDAHGFGVRGPAGRGSWAMTGIQSPRVLQVVTFGKAAGLSGAFVAGDQRLIEELLQHGRTYIFSTSPLPALAAAIPTCLEVLALDEWRREHLRHLQQKLQDALESLGRPLVINTPIVPIIIGDPERTMRVVEDMKGRGILLAGIRPPTVPEGSSRLRLSLSAAHSESDIDQLIQGLKALC